MSIKKLYAVLSYVHDMATSQPIIQAAFTYSDYRGTGTPSKVHHMEFDGALYETKAEALAGIEEFGVTGKRNFYVIQPVYRKE